MFIADRIRTEQVVYYCDDAPVHADTETFSVQFYEL